MPLTRPEVGLYTELGTINDLFERADCGEQCRGFCGVSVIFIKTAPFLE